VASNSRISGKIFPQEKAEKEIEVLAILAV
jgi:hypothetical protein